MQSYWFSKQSKINTIYNISVITITITMSIILANFGKYAISDCPFIWVFSCRSAKSNITVLVAHSIFTPSVYLAFWMQSRPGTWFAAERLGVKWKFKLWSWLGFSCRFCADIVKNCLFWTPTGLLICEKKCFFYCKSLISGFFYIIYIEKGFMILWFRYC